jgi:hypothetical protein
MQPCNRIYYSKNYWGLNMFRAAYRSSSGALNCICSLWFIHPGGDQPWQRPVTTWVYKPEVANTVWGSWWWAVCRSKHFKPLINFVIINSVTKLHHVGYFYCWIYAGIYLRCTDPWTSNTAHIHNILTCICLSAYFFVWPWQGRVPHVTLTSHLT